MGCFDYTCAISGLPITFGDDVRWLILTQNPYKDSRRVSIHDFAFPRTWPVRAKYNDYGSIEDYDKDSPAVKGIVEGFRRDLFEVGTGDNTCHDVSTVRGMDFESILRAVSEERVLVIRENWSDLEDHKEPPKGLPTLQRIRELLQMNNFSVAASNLTSGDYLVDEISHGWVRVRVSGYESCPEKLKIILPVLQIDYAAMITANSLGSFEAEIQVMPLPNSHHICFAKSKEDEKPLKNYEAFIHGKVWNSIIEGSKFSEIRQGVQREWEFVVMNTANTANIAKISQILANLERSSLGRDGYLGFSSIPFTTGPGEHTGLIAALHNKEPFSEQQISDFLDDVAGFACVERYLHGINYWWRPSWYAGQGNTYQKHFDWHTKLKKICQELRAPFKEEQERYEAERIISILIELWDATKFMSYTDETHPLFQVLLEACKDKEKVLLNHLREDVDPEDTSGFPRGAWWVLHVLAATSNINPVKEEHAGNLREAINDWLEWDANRDANE